MLFVDNQDENCGESNKKTGKTLAKSFMNTKSSIERKWINVFLDQMKMAKT